MPALRDFFGTSCPCCSQDILQQAPSTNRMPGEERAWCPSCNAKLSVEQLSQKRGGMGFLKRLFGGSPSS